MKVLALGADKGGCYTYRIFHPARVVGGLGVEISTDHELEADASENTKTGIVEVREVYTDADLIIIQRPLNNAMSALIKQAQRQGIATIVEIDDDFHSTSKFNIAHSGMFAYTHSNADWVSEACRLADHVTVSTPALEKYAPHGRVSVLRNYVPESIFEMTPAYESRSGSVVGWSGSTQTHPTDLQVTKGAVGQVLKTTGTAFGVVGDGDQVQSFLKLGRTTPFRKTGWVDVSEFYDRLVETMDIGIVPLEMSNFNQAKSSLKGIEMAALGIPFVASPTREYLRLEAYGIGKIASTPGDWRKHLIRWIQNPQQRSKDAMRYREIMQNEFTYEQHAHEWLEAWEKAVDFRKNNPAS